MPYIVGKLSTKVLILLQTYLIEDFHIKLWVSKVTEIPILRILGLQLGSPGTKLHLDVSHIIKYKEYYKGEDGGFPQVRAMVGLMNLCLLVVRSCTKSAPVTY
jgi:hypothetical protein